MNQNTKDLLYYYDLIYKIKSLADLIEIEDMYTERRIWTREEMVKEIDEVGEVKYTFSPFQEDVFKVVRKIASKANVSLGNLYEIHKYPDIVNEELEKLHKINKLHTDLLMQTKSNYTKELSNNSYRLVREKSNHS